MSSLLCLQPVVQSLVTYLEKCISPLLAQVSWTAISDIAPVGGEAVSAAWWLSGPPQAFANPFIYALGALIFICSWQSTRSGRYGWPSPEGEKATGGAVFAFDKPFSLAVVVLKRSRIY